MASRSFKPASYLASAAQQKPARSPRPSFNRSSSASSTASSRSEDGFAATIRSRNTREVVEGEGDYSASPRGHSTGNITGSPVLRPRAHVEGTPSKKRSKPISIEVPKRNLPTSYTPLTGRGDNLKGGYFPDYDDVQQKYHHNPFTNNTSGFPGPVPAMPQPSPGISVPMSPSNMSACSSQPSPNEVTPKPSGLTLSPLSFGPAPSLEGFAIPKGKYYPSNYVSPEASRVTTPRLSSAPAPPTTLQIPAFATRNKKNKGSTHERNSSDVKRKIQQYQRDMIAQAQHAAPHDTMKDIPEPTSARILPIGSPGPINTPLELDESDGYLVAGTRARKDGPASPGYDRQQNMVDAMINMERSRMHTSSLTTE